MKKILLIATGGTIASLEGKEGLTPVIKIDELINLFPEIRNFCEIETKQMFNIDSTNMQPEYWQDIVSLIKNEYYQYDGFVITHGTDTMAYTSAALSYMIQDSNKPIVITGAQNSIQNEKSDVKKNLIDSLKFACEGINGVNLIFDGKVINGCRAVKTRTKSHNAFESINYPYTAVFKKNKILLNSNILRKEQKDQKTKFYNSLCSDVFLLKLIPGSKPEIFDFIKKNYKGVIIESFGSGGIPFNKRRNLLKKLDELIKYGIIVVIKTQCFFEGSDLTLYEVGRKVLKKPIIPTGDMTSETAVTKLMWALGQSNDFKEIKKMFLRPINNDIFFN